MAEQPIEQLRKIRLDKLERLKKAGLNPFPARVDPVVPTQEARSMEGKGAAVAGRIMALRTQGKITFADVRDQSGKIQLFFSAEDVGKGYQQFVDLFDIGDLVRAEGIVFTTKAGEVSIRVTRYDMLAKSLLPLPEKWHGLRDVEERYRQRYLDLIANPDVRDFFVTRSKIIQVIRDYLSHQGFLEVETPILQPIPGGAAARPFVTHYHAYDLDVFLRVAPELYLKRLLVGGFEKVFEFARVFRNEGVDAVHNPEYTDLEFYWANVGYEELMDFTEDLVIEVAREVRGEATFERDGKKISLKKPFRRIPFHQATKKEESDEALKNFVRKEKGPLFVIDHPVGISPLAKRKNEREVERFQLVAGGMEFVNAFSELNDPLEQRQRFKEQEQARAKGDLEAQPFDEDFVLALEHGMPPAGGWGMGLDRFVLLLTGRHAIRETILFPFMKPKNGSINSPRREVK